MKKKIDNIRIDGEGMGSTGFYDGNGYGDGIGYGKYCYKDWVQTGDLLDFLSYTGDGDGDGYGNSSDA